MAQTWTRILNLKKADNQNYETSSIYSSKTSPSSSSLEDSYITLQSCSDDSLLSDNSEIKRNNHYIKHTKLNRNSDHITSLKRRIRKQQLRHEQNQLSSSTDLVCKSHSQQPVTRCQHRTKKSSHVVPLPSLVPNSRPVRTRIYNIKLKTNNC